MTTGDGDRSDGRAQLEAVGRARHLNPERGRVVAQLLDRGALGVDDGVGHGHRHGDGAAVAVGDQFEARHLLRRRVDGEPELGFARVALEAAPEVVGDVVVLVRDDGPVDETGHLLHDHLDPDLQQRQLPALAVDRRRGHVGLAHVGLVEHVRVLVQREQVARVRHLLELEQRVDVADARGRLLPLEHGAGRRVAVVVDVRGPARHDGVAVVAVVGDGRAERPVVVGAVAQRRPRVVTDGVVETAVDPGAQAVAVVETRDLRRDDAPAAEARAGRDARLRHPVLVEGDLLAAVAVGGVVEGQVREGVGHVAEGVAVRRRRQPLLERIEVEAGGRPVEGRRRRRPLVRASAQRLLELERRRRREVVVDGLGANLLVALRLAPLDDVPVAVVAELDEEVAAGVHARVDVGRPGHVDLHVGGSDPERLPVLVVDASAQEDVVDCASNTGAGAGQGQPVRTSR